MTEIADLLDAFQIHYGGLKYSPAQRAELESKYRWFKRGYKNAVYDEVVESHPMSFRSLPDMAVITKAMNNLSPPQVYEEPHSVPRIEYNPEVQEKINEMVRQRGEHGNNEERNRIRTKVMKGEATKYEKWWIHVIDDLGCNWAPMPEGWE